jgi:DNA-directed RNA polymerase subunit RPC12/RpoP
MTCPEEKCGREMIKKSEDDKKTEYVCGKCGSLRAVAKIVDDHYGFVINRGN